MEKTATIEVNGKRYDAVTGAVLGPASASLRRTGHNIDGFFRSRTTTAPRRVKVPSPVEGNVAEVAAKLSAATPAMRDIIKPARPAPKPRRPAASRIINHTRAHLPQAAKSRNVTVRHTPGEVHTLEVRRGKPNHVHHHSAQHSRTLRRDTVPAPETSTHNALRPQSSMQRTSPSLVALKKSVATIDPERLARAQTTHRSPLVAHHRAVATAGLMPTLAPLAVQPVPATPPVAPEPNKPGSEEGPVPPPQQGNQLPDMFEQAIAHANNFVDIRVHTARYKRKARVHVASMISGSLALVIVAAFVAYQNSPALQLKVAAFRAGVSTGAPNLADAGLTYNGARVGEGNLTLGFKGPGGIYQLTQTNTDLSDADMIQTIGSTYASGAPIYQVVLAGNTVVYRFGNTNATWVSNGEWYTLSANCPVTDRQVKTVVQHT